MNMNYALSIAGLVLASIPYQQANAQARTKEGFATTWERPITVMPDSLTNGDHKLPAYTIAVFETDANGVMDLWKADMKALSQEVTGSRPAKASGVILTSVSESPTNLLVTTTTEKKADMTRMTVAFILTDSTAAPADPRQEAYMRSLGVKYNKAVVQTQIDTYQKMLDKAGNKLTSAQGDQAKTQQNLTKANSNLEKLKAKRAKVMAANAEISGQIAGLEKKFALTNDPKDLQKLTKTREKLAKGETSVAKLMQSEAKAQGTVNKYQEQLPDRAADQQEITATKEELTTTLNALKRKHDSIQ
ncbi:MAG: hypothetical protein KA817_13945 [Flavobacteriales bacterium]|nr:hypothetical protein [Flavobacteriales bacterium]